MRSRCAGASGISHGASASASSSACSASRPPSCRASAASCESSMPVTMSRATHGRDTNEASRSEVEMVRSEEHTSELQSLMRISYAVFCLKKKKNKKCDAEITKKHYQLRQRE